jgi:hypothetical protein
LKRQFALLLFERLAASRKKEDLVSLAWKGNVSNTPPA